MQKRRNLNRCYTNGTMGRFARSWELAKQSYRVLKSNPQLALFPLVSGIISFIVLLTFIIPVALTYQGMSDAQFDAQARNPLYYVVLFAFYAVSYFVVIFFNCGLVWCAHEHLNGRPATFKDGLHMATKQLPQIILWSLIAATVGTILRAVSERAGLIGQIIIGLIGMVWSLATFFVVPLLIVERATAVSSVKRSATMLKRTWGEQVIAGVGIGAASGIFGLLGLIPMLGGVALGVATGMVWPFIAGFLVAVLYWLAVATIFAALSGIYQTALFMYASNGERSNAFSSDYFDQAFTEKPKKKFFGR
jgi:hypothetical protein